MDPDRLDRVLAAYFQPAPLPEGFARRMLESAAAADRATGGLVERLAVHATARGVSLIRAGRQPAATSVAARRLVARARIELAEYLAGKRAFFSVPVDLSGAAAFQRKVLAAAREIPFGEARPYAWVARRIGHPRAVRAVGTALGRNPVPVIVPCHRVLRSDGGLGGYIFGLDVKDRLLQIERTTPVFEGCTSTHIVCRVGCIHGRHMRPDNRVVFASVADARSLGYRPCRVCRPGPGRAGRG
ncbi:MAG: methylated-DNA--[protein]-cysteine S-methyltransferase [Candidatus Rokubacteria bacterium]|nr:methylated-DNA--[protein]-cysteine S-methyltransferase [Candidatus Rokubacteria bacterium]MBI3106846.1 methylated-DNA--[protein]-cysteine S-methyltransferase [Candidatus Rokubacteria bacterium]